MGPVVIIGRHLAILLLVLHPFGQQPKSQEARPETGPLEQALVAEGAEVQRASAGRYLVLRAGNAERLARLLARFETEYRAFWQGRLPGPPPAPPTTPVTVFVFARPDSLRRAAARLGIAQTAFDAGGIFLRYSLTIAVGTESRLERVLEASLVHEAAHLMNLEILGPGLSPWLNEGLAGYCQYSAISADGQVRLGVLDEGSELSHPQPDGSVIHYQFVPKKSLSYLLGQFFRDHSLSLGPVLEARSTKEFYGHDAQLRYAASWTLVHLLAEGRTRSAGPLRPRLDRYAALEREGRGGAAALLDAVGMSMQELDDAWYRHVKKLW